MAGGGEGARQAEQLLPAQGSPWGCSVPLPLTRPPRMDLQGSVGPRVWLGLSCFEAPCSLDLGRLQQGLECPYSVGAFCPPPQLASADPGTGGDTQEAG